MSFLDAASLALSILCPLAVTVFAATLVWALSGTDDRPVFVSDDDKPLAVDPPVVPAYLDHVPAGMVLFFGAAVHTACVGPYLRDGTRPCAGCADHFERVLTGAQ